MRQVEIPLNATHLQSFSQFVRRSLHECRETLAVADAVLAASSRGDRTRDSVAGGIGDERDAGEQDDRQRGEHRVS